LAGSPISWSLSVNAYQHASLGEERSILFFSYFHL